MTLREHMFDDMPQDGPDSNELKKIIEEEIEPPIVDLEEDDFFEMTSDVALRRILHHPILSPEQEQILFKAREKYPQPPIQSIVSDLLNEISPHDSKKRDVWLDFFSRCGSSIDEIIISANCRLIYREALKRVGYSRSFELVDLFQEGYLGLNTAIDKFEISRGFKFSTYATWWIRQAMDRAITDRAKLIRTPVHMEDHLRRYKNLRNEIASREKRIPSVLELQLLYLDRYPNTPAATIIGITESERSPIYNMCSLDLPIGIEGDRKVADLVGEEEQGLPQLLDEDSVLTFRENLRQVCQKISMGRHGDNSRFDLYYSILARKFGGLGELKPKIALKEISALTRVNQRKVKSFLKELLLETRQNEYIRLFGDSIDLWNRLDEFVLTPKIPHVQKQELSNDTALKLARGSKLWGQIPVKTKTILNNLFGCQINLSNELASVYDLSVEDLQKYATNAINIIKYHLTSP